MATKSVPEHRIATKIAPLRFAGQLAAILHEASFTVGLIMLNDDESSLMLYILEKLPAR